MAKRARDEDIPGSNGSLDSSKGQEDAEESPSKQLRSTSKYNYAVICSSNINRSMEAHVALFNNKLQVGSYGAGRCVNGRLVGFILFAPGKGSTAQSGQLSDFRSY